MNTSLVKTSLDLLNCCGRGQLFVSLLDPILPQSRPAPPGIPFLPIPGLLACKSPPPPASADEECKNHKTRPGGRSFCVADASTQVSIDWNKLRLHSTSSAPVNVSAAAAVAAAAADVAPSRIPPHDLGSGKPIEASAIRNSRFVAPRSSACPVCVCVEESFC